MHIAKQGLVALLIFSMVTGCGRGALNDDGSEIMTGGGLGEGEGQGFFQNDGNGVSMPTSEQLAQDPVNYTNGLGTVLVSRPQNNNSALNAIPRLVAVLAGVIAAVRYIFSRRTGTVITRWGNGTAPVSLAAVGGELVYSGYGYGSHYTHAGREPECVVGGDAGTLTPSDHPDAIYVLATGGATLVPSAIPARKLVTCAKIRVRSATTVIHGSDKCPAEWTRIYSGYEMGGYYNHAGRGSAPICVDTDFDGTTADNGSAAYIYGTALYGQTPDSNYQNQKYLKCAVCAAM